VQIACSGGMPSPMQKDRDALLKHRRRLCVSVKMRRHYSGGFPAKCPSLLEKMRLGFLCPCEGSSRLPGGGHRQREGPSRLEADWEML